MREQIQVPNFRSEDVKRKVELEKQAQMIPKREDTNLMVGPMVKS